MIENELDDYQPELEDMLKGRNFTIALEKYKEWAGKEIKKDPFIEKTIYEGIYEDACKPIERKLGHLPYYVEHKNYRRLDLERKIIARNLDYLTSLFEKSDPNNKDLGTLISNFKKFRRDIRKKLEDFENKNRDLIAELEIKFNQEKQKESQELEKESDQKKVQLLIEPFEGDFHNKNIEYLPFLGVTAVRLRVVVNKPVKNLWIKPRYTPDLYSENPEWSHYICGMNNEHRGYDLRKGFMATYGGGNQGAFIIGEVNDHREQYVFFFLRHQNEKLQNSTPKGEARKEGGIQKIINFSITFEAIEEGDWTEEVLDEVTIQLKYPEDIIPDLGKILPDFKDPKCPVIANYDYDYEGGKRYREITFKGNQLAGYYPRWIPLRKISYEPITAELKEKLKNLIVRSYPNGEVKIFCNLQLIGHLKGSLSESVFYDPLKMVTAELYRFYSDDFVALRIWFWWIDMRLNDITSGKRTTGMFHEMPDFERVDFIINLKNITKGSKMVEFIATDVHWKEFWLDVKDVKKPIDVKFTNIGVDLINWKQLVAFFSHHVGILYNPLPAILYAIYQSLDGNAFYCVMCGHRTKMPENVKALQRKLEKFNEKDLSEPNYGKKAEKLLADQMTDLMCPDCSSMFTKEKKLQYLFLFADFSKLHKHLKNDILQAALKRETKEAAAPLRGKIQNCHVPTPVDGKTSHEWCSSTVIKSLSLAQLEADQAYEDRIHDKKLDYYDITNIEGLDNRYATPLYELGIVKIRALVNASPETLLNKVNLEDLEDPEKEFYKQNILRWQEMAKLYQLKGIRSQYSDLLVEVGYNLQKLHDYTGHPIEIWLEMKKYNDRTNDVSRMPPLKDVSNWITEAKALKL